MRTAVDTSILVASFLSWHAVHTDALRAMKDAAGGGGDSLVVPAPALAEAYSVMTRLPSPHRLAPDVAFGILHDSLESRTTVVALTGRQTWRVLNEAASRGIAGGRVYDFLILACARKGRAARLLTLDRSDFPRFAEPGIEIVSP